MKTNLSTLLLASLASTVALCTALPAQALTITKNVTINNLDGILAGNTFTGSISYDDSGLTGNGEDFLPVSSILFNIQGTQYTELDDPFAEAFFFDGDFLGISFTVGSAGIDPKSFSVIPGFFDATEAYFTYDFTGGAGTGDIIYASATPIPTPSLILPLIGLGLGAWRKKSNNAL